MDFNIIIESLCDIQRELNGSMNRYYEKRELEEKEEKQLAKIKENLTKMLLERIRKEEVKPNTLCKHFLSAKLASNGLLKINEIKILTSETFEIPEEILKRGIEEEEQLKKIKEKEEAKEIKKQTSKISTKKTFTKMELKNFFNEEEVDVYLMLRSKFLPEKIRYSLEFTLNSEKILMLKALLKTKKEEGDYETLILLLKEKEEAIIQKEIEHEFYSFECAKKRIDLSKINFFKENESKILKEIRKEEVLYYRNELKSNKRRELEALYEKEKEKEKEIITIKRVAYLKNSLLQLYFYYPELTFFEKKLGLKKKEEFLKLHEVMQHLKKSISITMPKEGIFLGNDDFFEKKKIDFLKELNVEK